MAYLFTVGRQHNNTKCGLSFIFPGMRREKIALEAIWVYVLLTYYVLTLFYLNFIFINWGSTKLAMSLFRV